MNAMKSRDLRLLGIFAFSRTDWSHVMDSAIEFLQIDRSEAIGICVV